MPIFLIAERGEPMISRGVLGRNSAMTLPVLGLLRSRGEDELAALDTFCGRLTTNVMRFQSGCTWRWLAGSLMGAIAAREEASWACTSHAATNPWLPLVATFSHSPGWPILALAVAAFS